MAVEKSNTSGKKSGKFADRIREAYQHTETLPVSKNTDDGTLQAVVVDPGGRETGAQSLVGGGERPGVSLLGLEDAVGNYPESVIYVPLTDHPLEQTRGKKMIPVGAPEGVTAREFGRVLSGAYRVYLSTGKLSSKEIAQTCGLSEARVIAIAQTEQFSYALAVRGIDVGDDHFLTEEMDRALLVAGDTLSRYSFNERMRRAGISSAKLAAWKKNPVFRRLYTEVTEAQALSYEAAMLELSRKAGEGDMAAINKSLEISGRFDPNKQQALDALSLVNTIMEILARRLAGQPELMQQIAQDLRQTQEQQIGQIHHVIEGA